MEAAVLLGDPAAVAAIQAAEKGTSGEIRVFVSPRAEPEAYAAAARAFQRMGMKKTQRRNAVLIFLAPRSQTFAVVGDVGVHEKCGDEFWLEIVQAMKAHFRRGAFTEGLVLGIQRTGEVLARHFPPEANDVNELPDEAGEE